MPETFTIEQARELIPWLQKSFDVMQPVIAKLGDSRRDAQTKSKHIQSNGGGEAERDMIQAQESLRNAEEEINQLIASIVDLGILIKSIETGLFDFPSLMAGNLIYLCWQAGEPELMYWHTIDSGFAGRQPL
ncbi:DUF2203 family protein [SAR202 cluster bacterium AC-647-N09_OGT_505m]|nr:DUF2203 family protein [SAR202 cluster bacterium AC-647-N09_OGT_505m]